jgi:glycosyltransferase involved in cell wall biosynthesis
MISNDIGVVVIGRNEGERLINCLKSVKIDADTIVYVDSGSTDGSIAAAARLGVSIVNLDMAQPFSAARARNEGFEALTALKPDVQFVQFIDGDCELVPSWLDMALAFLAKRKDVAVVCGRRRERHPEASIYNRLCDLEWDTPIGDASACGGDSMVRSEAFKAVGGYRKQLIAGEEPEFCLRLREKGWKVWRLDAEMTRHDAAIVRFSQWWVRAIRGGYGYTEVALLHRNSQSRIYAREVTRAVIWGSLVPLGIAVATFLYPAAIVIVLIYPIQVYRIALRRGATKSTSWAYAIFIMIAKFAEFQGFLKYHLRRLGGQFIKPIEYKKSN